MTDDTTRLECLERIEARAKAVGGSAWWNAEYNDLEVNLPGGVSFTFKLDDANIEAAEWLLSKYEPGPVVRYFLKPVMFCTEKVLMFEYDDDHPMPTEGTYKLIKVEVDHEQK